MGSEIQGVCKGLCKARHDHLRPHHTTTTCYSDRMRPSIILHYKKYFCSDFRTKILLVVQTNRVTHSICVRGGRRVAPQCCRRLATWRPCPWDKGCIRRCEGGLYSNTAHPHLCQTEPHNPPSRNNGVWSYKLSRRRRRSTWRSCSRAWLRGPAST